MGEGRLLKMSGGNEQLQAFLKVLWCKLRLDAVAKEEQVGVTGNNKKSVKIVSLEHILELNPKP